MYNYYLKTIEEDLSMYYKEWLRYMDYLETAENEDNKHRIEYCEKKLDRIDTQMDVLIGLVGRWGYCVMYVKKEKRAYLQVREEFFE